MVGLLKRGNVWFARLHIPENRWEDVGRAMGAASGIKREIVKTLGTPSKREAQKRAPEAERAMRDEVDRALSRAKLPLLTDWTASWHERAAAIRKDLYTRGHAVAGFEYEADGTATPVYRGEGIINDAEWASETVRSRQGDEAAERFLKVVRRDGLSIGQAMRQWLEDEARRVKPTTIVSHKGAMTKLANFLSGHHSIPSLDVAEFDQITRRMAGEFIKDRRAASSAATIQREFSAYSGLWRWAIRRGFTGVNPWTDQTAGLKALRDDEQEDGKRAFSTDELVTLLRAGQDDLAPNGSALAPTFWDAMRLALLTGTRLSELMNMPVAGVIEDGTALAVAADPKRGGKTKSASRIVPLHPIAQRVIKDRLGSLPDVSPDAPLWPEMPPGGYNESRAKTFTTRFIILRRRVLGESDEVDFHSLRRSWRTFAETATHNGGGLNEALIDLLFGHKRGSLGLDIYSDWTRLGRPHMRGKLAEKLKTLREAMDDVVTLGMPKEVLTALEETQDDRPAVVRMKPAFSRS